MARTRLPDAVPDRVDGGDAAARLAAEAELIARAVHDPRAFSLLYRNYLDIAHNVIVDTHRARRSHQPLDAAAQMLDPTPSPEDLALDGEGSQAVQTLLARLTPDQARVVELRLAGLSEVEIALLAGGALAQGSPPPADATPGAVIAAYDGQDAYSAPRPVDSDPQIAPLEGMLADRPSYPSAEAAVAGAAAAVLTDLLPDAAPRRFRELAEEANPAPILPTKPSVIPTSAGPSCRPRIRQQSATANIIANSSPLARIEPTRQGWPVEQAHGQEVDMGKLQNGAIALVVSAAMLSGGMLGASAQEDEGPHEDESPVAAGTLDDGQSLLPQAGITLEAAVQAAQGAASGTLGEVDLEYLGGKLVFNVDVGNQDVKVDAASGEVLSVDADDEGE